MATEIEAVQRLPAGLRSDITALVVEIYKADNVILKRMHDLVVRYNNVFSGPEFKQLLWNMERWWRRASDLMARIADEKLRDVLTKPTDKATVKLYKRRLQEETEGYAGDEICRAFSRSREARQCDSVFQESCLIQGQVKSKSYASMIILLYKIMRRVEEIGGGSVARDLGVFVAQQAERWFCYDENTRVLTDCGLKYFRDLTGNEHIATLNRETGCFEWQLPIAYHQYFYDGELVKFKGAYYDLMVTPNHNLYVRSGTGKYELRTAGSIATFLNGYKRQPYNSRRIHFKRDASWIGRASSSAFIPSLGVRQAALYDQAVRLREANPSRSMNSIAKEVGLPDGTLWNWFAHKNKPPKSFLTFKLENWLQFLGWYMAEGDTQIIRHQYRIRFSVPKKEEQDTIIAITQSLGLNAWRDKECGVVVTNRDVAIYLKQLGVSYQKYIPAEVKALDAPSLEVLLASMIAGDGTKKPSGAFVYGTVSPRLASDVVEIAIKCGYVASITPSHRGPSQFINKKGNLQTIKSNLTFYNVNLTKKHRQPEIFNKPRYVPYRGFVYCITVPNGLILVERNGKIVWAGNSDIIQGDPGKFSEERTGLMMFAAAAIDPTSEFNVDDPKSLALIQEIMGLAVGLTALRLSTHFGGPETLELEESMFEKWLNFWTVERAAALQHWIEETSRAAGYARRLILLPEAVYEKDQVLSRDGFYDGLFPTPFLEVPAEYWKHGIMSDEPFPPDVLQGDIPLRPLKADWLMHSSLDQVEMTGAIGSHGSGKSSLQDALACWSIDRGSVVLRLSCPRDQGLTVVLPSAPYEKKGKRDYEYLTNQLRLRPRGFPAKFITVIENDSDLNSSSTYTMFDLFIYVDHLSSVHLPWKQLLSSFTEPSQMDPRARALMRELQVESYKPKQVSNAGFLMIRDLNDQSRSDLMRRAVINNFFAYRVNDRSENVRVQVDEIQKLLGALFQSPEEAALVREMQTNLVNIRGLNLGLDYGAIRPASLQPEILEYTSTFCLGELRESGAERTHSTRGRIVEAIESRLGFDRDFLPLMTKIMEHVRLREHHLFFLLNTEEGVLRLVRPLLPPYVIENKKFPPRKQFDEFAKETGVDLLRKIGDVDTLDLRGGSAEKSSVY